MAKIKPPALDIYLGLEEYGSRAEGIDLFRVSQQARAGLQHERLTLVAADAAHDPAAVSLAVSGCNAVVTVLGVGLGLRSHGIMTLATPSIVDSMQRAGVRRLVFISAFGVGGSAPTAPLRFRLAWRLLLSEVYMDKARAESFVVESPLDWTILAPVRMKDGPAAGGIRLTEGTPDRGPWLVTRADVAAAALRCLGDATTIRKRFVVQ